MDTNNSISRVLTTENTQGTIGETEVENNQRVLTPEASNIKPYTEESTLTSSKEMGENIGTQSLSAREVTAAGELTENDKKNELEKDSENVEQLQTTENSATETVQILQDLDLELDSLAVFSKVFEKVNGYSVSRLGRKELSTEQTKNLIYGEMPFISTEQIFDQILDRLNQCKVFYDLGSGTGKILISTALVCQNLEKIVGVELVPLLNETAEQAKKSFATFRPNLASKIELQNKNFFDINLDTADCIFLHYPMNGEDSIKLYTRLEEKLVQELKPGSIIISVIRRLENKNDFRKISEPLSIVTSYGKVLAHFYQRV